MLAGVLPVATLNMFSEFVRASDSSSVEESALLNDGTRATATWAGPEIHHPVGGHNYITAAS